MNKCFTNFLFFFSLLIFVINSCVKDEIKERDYPRLSTLEVTNITQIGAQLNAQILTKGKEDITDHGFIVGENSSLNLNNQSGRVISLGAFDGKGKYTFQMDTSFDGSKPYYVSAYLKTKTYTVIGNPVKFICLRRGAPVVFSVTPRDGLFWGDTLVIKGKNFSYTKEHNKIYFNDTTTFPVYASDTILKVTIPAGLTKDTALLFIEVLGNRASFKTTLNFITPVLLDFWPKQGGPTDTVTLKFNFSSTTLPFNIYLQETNGTKLSCKIAGTARNLLKIIVPGFQTSLNSNILVSLKTLSLKSSNLKTLPPVITSFTPEEGRYSSEVKITGKYFNEYTSAVTIGDKNAEITSVTSNEVWIKLPDIPLGNYNFTVTSLGQSTQSGKTFHNIRPTITKVSPSEFVYGDTVSLIGEYLPESLNLIEGVCGNYSVLSTSATLIKFIVPWVDTTGYISVDLYGGLSITSPEPYKILKPVLISYSPIEGKEGDIITVNGKNFYNGGYFKPSRYSDLYFLDGSKENFRFKINRCLSGNLDLSLTMGYYSTVIKNFKFNSPYTLIDQKYPSDFQGFHTFCYVIQDKVYIGTGWNNEKIFVRDLNGSEWTYKMTPVINSDFNYSTTFCLNDKIYLVSSSTNKVEEIDPINGTIAQKNNFPGTPTVNALAFSIGNKGYICTGDDNGTWEYDGIDDIWTKKADFMSFSDPPTAFVFIIKSKAYVVNGIETWEFDPSANIWTNKSRFPGSPRYGAIAFTVNDLGYVTTGTQWHACFNYYQNETYKDTWQYNPVSDSWTPKSSYPGPSGNGGIAFVNNNKVYLGLCYNQENESNSWFDLFEYDPTLDTYNAK